MTLLKFEQNGRERPYEARSGSERVIVELYSAPAPSVPPKIVVIAKKFGQFFEIENTTEA